MKSRFLVVCLSLAVFGVAVGLRAGETGQKPSKTDLKQKAEKLKQDLQLREEILGQQFNDFLLSLLKLKQRLDKGSREDQERAKILGRALDKARDATISTGFDKLVKILKTKDLGTTGDIKSALKDSQKLSNELQTLLAILREDTRAAQLREERLRLERLIKKLEEVIRAQKVVRGQTDFRGTDKIELKKRQEDVTNKTAKIGQEIAKNQNGGDKNTEGKAKTAGAKAGGKTGKGKNAGKTNKGQAKSEPKDGKGDGKKADAKGGDKSGKPSDGKKAGGSKSPGSKGSKASDAKGSKGSKGSKAGDGKGKKAGEPKDMGKDGKAKKGDDPQSKVKSKGKDDGAKKKGDGDKKGPQANSKSSPKSGDKKSGSKSSSPKSGSKAGDKKSGGKSSQGDAKSGKSSSGKGSPKSGGQKSSGSQSKSQKSPPQQAQQPTGKKQIQDAEYKQHQAEKKIAKGENDKASDKQGEAIKDLEEARKRLEDLLRQIREEELERLLAVLIDRCAKMLRMQIVVRDETLDLQKAIQNNAGERVFPADEQKAHRLSDDEEKIVEEADKAIEILEAEGTAVAFPEVFQQVRQDMFHVQKRLKKVGVVADPNLFAEHVKFTKSHLKVTVVIENDIIATLKEMIKALEKAKKDAKSKPKDSKSGQPPPNQNQKLLDLIAELKLIRSMQMRVNNRTKVYAQEYTGEQAGADHIVTELRNLANRQQRVFEVTNKIAKGDNK